MLTTSHDSFNSSKDTSPRSGNQFWVASKMSFFETGYLCLPGLCCSSWLARMCE